MQNALSAQIVIQFPQESKEKQSKYQYSIYNEEKLFKTRNSMYGVIEVQAVSLLTRVEVPLRGSLVHVATCSCLNVWDHHIIICW